MSGVNRRRVKSLNAQCLPAIGGFLAVIAAGTMLQAQTTIPPGRDCFVTNPETTRVIFGSPLLPPLPADFFFPGSRPFSGTIELDGEQLPGYQWDVSAVAERKGRAVMPGPATVEVELVELHLVSVAPITVWDDQGPPSPHLYHVDIELNPFIPSLGFMVIQAESSLGGTFSLEGRQNGGILLYPRFTFSPLDGASDPIVWDSPMSEFLETDADQPWQYETPLTACETDNLFYPVPGVEFHLVLDGGETGEHGAYPPWEVMGCCLPGGECIDKPGQDCVAMGGTPQLELCAAYLASCCIPQGTSIICVEVNPVCCDDLGGVPQGPDNFCTEPQACCLEDGTCVMTDEICCDDLGGTPQGFGTICTVPEGCYIPDPLGFGMICMDVDPICCDDLGGARQGAGTACVDMLITCCIPIDPTIVCVDVDPLCCDDLGGTPGFQPHCLGDPNGNGIDDACEEPPPLEPKWHQPTHGGLQGFDAPSDLWWLEPELSIVWDQRPNPALPGQRAHDWMDPEGAHNWITLADDWQWPEGREVSDIHWWGNYELDDNGQEKRGAGVDHFHLSVHMCFGPGPQGWHVPMDPPIWTAYVPFDAAQETFTGLTNSEGSRIYRYRFDALPPIPPTWYYWLDVTAGSVAPGEPAVWRWQESDRRPYPPPPFPEHPAPAAERFNARPWETILLDGVINADLAFMITSPISLVPDPLPNKVVADDFISDGRPILAVNWHGSYWDERYMPLLQPIEPYVLDGWFITFHHAAPDDWCPPDASSADAPSVLAVYFAPMEAVGWAGLWMCDCFGHGIFVYGVDLDRCCLLCTHADPRLPDMPPPGEPDRFREVAGLRYWMGIQAVVGVKWIKPACAYEQRILTGHVPSDLTADGHFWGWHTSPVDRLDEACTGRIVDFDPYPPQCWSYGEWQKQPWMCPETPVIPPVNMAFDLLAPPCAPFGDANGDGVLNIDDVECFVHCLIEDFTVGCWCGCADMNHDGAANGLDIQPFVDALIAP